MPQLRCASTGKAFEAVEVTQLCQVIVARFLSGGVSGQITRRDPDLISQEPQHLDGYGLAWCEQPPWISQGTELKRKTHFIVGAAALSDLLKIKIIKSVMLMQASRVSR